MDITLLEKVVAAAIRQGATEAEVMALESTEFVVEVRLGEIETLQESASRGIGLRVIHEGRQASASTSNLQPEALDRLVAEAVEMIDGFLIDGAGAENIQAGFLGPIFFTGVCGHVLGTEGRRRREHQED